MARARRKSTILEVARQRLNGLKSIKPTPNLGPNFTPEIYDAKATAFTNRLDGYNRMLAALDDEQNGIDADESELREMNRRALSAVEAQYGPDSSEYELVGGTRQSERKRGPKKAKPSGKGPGSPAPGSGTLST